MSIIKDDSGDEFDRNLLIGFENSARSIAIRHQNPSNIDQVRWVSTTTIFDRNGIGHVEPDGYTTAHASMASLTPTGSGTGEKEIPRPRTFDTDCISVTIVPDNALDETASIQSNQSGELCRICHGEATMDTPLIAPCNCSGSMKFVHQECIQIWLRSSGSLSCELCRFTYLTGTKMEPIREWKSLDLSLLERWKIACCVMIQLFAICYFILSVEALVRAVKDFHVPQAAMWLWIKIIMSIFGISVSVACTIRQCKTFFRLIRRWEMYNRKVFVRDRCESAEGATSATRALLGGSK